MPSCRSARSGALHGRRLALHLLCLDLRRRRLGDPPASARELGGSLVLPLPASSSASAASFSCMPPIRARTPRARTRDCVAPRGGPGCPGPPAAAGLGILGPIADRTRDHESARDRRRRRLRDHLAADAAALVEGEVDAGESLALLDLDGLRGRPWRNRRRTPGPSSFPAHTCATLYCPVTSAITNVSTEPFGSSAPWFMSKTVTVAPAIGWPAAVRTVPVDRRAGLERHVDDVRRRLLQIDRPCARSCSLGWRP